MIGATKFLSARRVQVTGWVLVAAFAWLIWAFHDARTGFTSLLVIGEQLEPTAVPRLRQVPHYVYDGVAGYDGAYYVQLALHPTLTAPELKKSIDNLPYRAKRMLMYWTAWLLGLGRDAWIVNAYALLNVGAWFALAWVLLRWFPLNTWGNLLRWGGVLFSHGVCMSVRHSLVDLPSLLLIALAIAALERGRRGRGIVALAAAALTKETSALAVTALLDPERGPERAPIRGPYRWLRFAGGIALVVLPLAAWALYVRWRVGPQVDTGLNNFSWPGAGLAEKWGTVVSEVREHGWYPAYFGSLLAVGSLTVQLLFIVTRWRPAQAWWRVGAVFSGLMLVVAQPVWEGYPGAATRVLLPLTLAFNVLVPTGRRWFAVLLLGNLTVLMAPEELKAPYEFFRVSGDRTLVANLKVERAEGWHGAESIKDLRWRWSAGEAGLRVTNATGGPVALAFVGQATSAGDERRLRVIQGEAMIWSEMITPRLSEVRFGYVAPPGESTVLFTSGNPPLLVGGDPRPMAFKIVNLEIVVAPTRRSR